MQLKLYQDDETAVFIGTPMKIPISQEETMLYTCSLHRGLCEKMCEVRPHATVKLYLFLEPPSPFHTVFHLCQLTLFVASFIISIRSNIPRLKSIQQLESVETYRKIVQSDPGFTQAQKEYLKRTSFFFVRQEMRYLEVYPR